MISNATSAGSHSSINFGESTPSPRVESNLIQTDDTDTMIQKIRVWTLTAAAVATLGLAVFYAYFCPDENHC